MGLNAQNKKAPPLNLAPALFSLKKNNVPDGLLYDRDDCGTCVSILIDQPDTDKASLGPFRFAQTVRVIAHSDFCERLSKHYDSSCEIEKKRRSRRTVAKYPFSQYFMYLLVRVGVSVQRSGYGWE